MMSHATKPGPQKVIIHSVAKCMSLFSAERHLAHPVLSRALLCNGLNAEEIAALQKLRETVQEPLAQFGVWIKLFEPPQVVNNSAGIFETSLHLAKANGNVAYLVRGNNIVLGLMIPTTLRARGVLRLLLMEWGIVSGKNVAIALQSGLYLISRSYSPNFDFWIFMPEFDFDYTKDIKDPEQLLTSLAPFHRMLLGSNRTGLMALSNDSKNHLSHLDIRVADDLASSNTKDEPSIQENQAFYGVTPIPRPKLRIPEEQNQPQFKQDATCLVSRVQLSKSLGGLCKAENVLQVSMELSRQCRTALYKIQATRHVYELVMVSDTAAKHRIRDDMKVVAKEKGMIVLSIATGLYLFALGSSPALDVWMFIPADDAFENWGPIAAQEMLSQLSVKERALLESPDRREINSFLDVTVTVCKFLEKLSLQESTAGLFRSTTSQPDQHFHALRDSLATSAISDTERAFPSAAVVFYSPGIWPRSPIRACMVVVKSVYKFRAVVKSVKKWFSEQADWKRSKLIRDGTCFTRLHEAWGLHSVVHLPSQVKFAKRKIPRLKSH